MLFGLASWIFYKFSQNKGDEVIKQFYNIIQNFLYEVIYNRASEADLTPAGDKMRVRFVIDGVVNDRTPMDLPEGQAMIQFLKPIAGLNPEEIRKQVKPPKTIPRVPGHAGDFFRACKDPSAPAPCSNFDYSARLTEIVLLGTVALRCAGETLVYDTKAGRFTNSERANGFIKRQPRKGWEFGYQV